MDAVAKRASRSLRRERRIFDSSSVADGPCCFDAVDPGGFFVTSLDELVGRDAQAASRSLE